MILYAHAVNEAILQVGALPRVWWDGTRWHDWRDLATAATDPTASGWLPVTETARPADTATTTTDYSVALVAGVPTVTWTPRPWTVDELAARQQATTRDTLTDTAKLAARLTRLAAYKTNSDIVAALDRTNSTVIATADLNRLFKTMLRREERLTATVALLVRLIDLALLADVSDATDA